MKGIELKKRLRRTGRTLKEISELVGISPQSLNQLLGVQDVKSGILEQLAAALGMSIAELYDVPTSTTATTTGNGNTILNGNGNTNISPTDCSALLAEKDEQIRRLIDIVDKFTDATK